MGRKIRQAAVIGSGVMGGGIAALLASAGIRTLLLDIVPPGLSESEAKDPLARNRIVKNGLDAMIRAQPPLLMHPADGQRIAIGNLEDDFQKLADCDWIVEVVVEHLGIKQQLLQRIESVRKADAIVSTNTSGIPLEKMSAGLSPEFRAHFLGTHFFNPVRYMKLLEIIPGQETLPEVIEFIADFGERRLGKGIVWAKDTPNFVGNRIGVHGIVRAMQLMLEEGLAIVEVDALFGPALGRPKTAMFKTSDLVGLDVLAHVAANTFDLVPQDESRNDFKMPEFVQSMVANKLLGKKSQAGFYKTELTPEWQKIRKVIDPKTLQYSEVQPPTFDCLKAARKAHTLPEKMQAVVFGEDRGARFAWKALAANLIYAANRIPEISDSIVEIDNAMKWGFNFEMGPFETWDALGVARTIERMQAENMAVPEKVQAMIDAGNDAFYRFEKGVRHYYDFGAQTYLPIPAGDAAVSLSAAKADGRTVKSCPSASLVDLGDGVFCCEFTTKMNAINSEMIDFVHEALDHVNTHGQGMVVGNQAGGMPGAFSAGADLKYVRELVAAGRLDDIEKFLERAQQANTNARYAPFPVVAAPFGLTLGGGCEVSLGADRIVAHSELYMGLVEIGVGLLPAGGGCTNLWRRFVGSLSPAVNDLDLGKLFVPAFMNIAMAKVTSSAADARASGFLGACDRIVFNRDHLIGEAKTEVLRLVADGYFPPASQPIPVLGEAAMGMINAELYNMANAGFVSEYDVFLAQKIATVLSGGQTRSGAMASEQAMLTLERKAFIELLQEEKSLARIDHMLKTGKPLRN